MRNKQKIFGIDLFAGAGGLSLGAQWAGVEITHAVENSASASRTYRANHPGTHVFEDDIRKLTPPPKSKSGPTILFGGPPCQGFSTSNQRTRSEKNLGNWLFSEFFRYGKEIKPDWILLENVIGLKATAGGKFARMIMQSFDDLGYSATLWTLCSADYGVPQNRHRLFFVGKKCGEAPPPPERSIAKQITVRQAISDLPILPIGSSDNLRKYRATKPSRYATQMRDSGSSCTGHLVTMNNSIVQKRYRHIPPGGNWQDIPKHLMKNYTNLNNSRSRHTGVYRRLEWDAPSVVIANYRKNMLVHPEQNRGLSVREACRIQSFPDSYELFGSIGFQQQQVSNAVPPLLAKAVFSHIIDCT